MSRSKRPLYIGKDTQTNEEVFLERKWFETHLHLIGPPGSGKTRLLLWMFQELCRDPRATIVLINPKGALARMARDWAIGHGLSKRLVWLDPGDSRVPGYNPLHPNGLQVATHAKAVREAIRSAWGQSSFDETPQLARFLYLSLAISLALGQTLLDALRLLRPGAAGSTIRRNALAMFASGKARGERSLHQFLGEMLAWFESLRDQRQEELAASTVARLESFLSDPNIVRILAQPRSIDLGEIIRDLKILLVNLELGRPLFMDDLKLLGRFLVNDVLNHVSSRPPSPNDPVYLIVDEVQNFATRDLCSVLDMGRELGLHCILAHQNLGQLQREDEELYASVRGCALTKFYFGGLTVEDLEILMKDACIEEFDPYKVKDELTTLELDPIESTRRVVTTGTQSGSARGAGRGRSRAWSNTRSIGLSASQGESETDGESSGTSISSGDVTGHSEGFGGGETLLPNGEIIDTSHAMEGTSDSQIMSHTEVYADTHSRGTHRNQGIQISEADGESETLQETRNASVSEGISASASDNPFYEYNKSRRVSSRTFESDQEFFIQKIQDVKRQPQAHSFLKVPGKRGRLLALPQVKTPLIASTTRAAGLERIFSQPFYSSLSECESTEIVLNPDEPASKTQQPIVAVVRSAEIDSAAEENFSGVEVMKPWKKRKRKE